MSYGEKTFYVLLATVIVQLIGLTAMVTMLVRLGRQSKGSSK